MANNNGQNQKTEQVQQQVAQAENPQVPQQPEQPVVQQQAVVPPAEETGFKAWLKKHKKGVIATVVGAVTAGGSAFVAYKKGKAAGIMSVPVPENDDYSLDPNRE